MPFGRLWQRDADDRDGRPKPGITILQARKKRDREGISGVPHLLGLGRDRSIATAADAAGENVDVAKQWSSHYSWQERCAHYDAHGEPVGQEVREELETTHKRELMKFRKDQQRRAEKLGKVADLLIKHD